MFKHNNLTDFEKLLFAQRYIEDLIDLCKKKDLEIGKLKSEIDELKYIISQNKDKQLILNQRKQIRSLDSALRRKRRNYDLILEKYVKLQQDINEIRTSMKK